MPFLKNTWYLAAWSEEVGATPLARTIADVPIALFRDESGAAAAVLDMCPHRFVPLSRGRVEDGMLVCGYHGLGFGRDGACRRNPHGPIVSSLAVRAFTLVERHAALWLWLGDPAAADPAKIPDLSFIDQTPPESRASGYLVNTANYLLMVDNIMDLSHADYLHPDTLGGGINTRTKGKVEEQGDRVTIRWHADNELLPPVQNAFLPEPGQRADFRNEVTWHPPGVMVQRLAFGPTGRMATEGADSLTVHAMTPESKDRTHYFFCHTGDALRANPGLTPQIRAVLLAAFGNEDSPMLAAQQERIGDADFWSLKPALLPIDTGAVQARRRMDRLIAEEQRA